MTASRCSSPGAMDPQGYMAPLCGADRGHADRRGGRDGRRARVPGHDDGGKRLDAARVERGARLLAQEPERALGRPRLAVDAVGDERVVDVAGGEDPRPDRELLLGETGRGAGAVEPLVVLADEAEDRRRKAAELVQQLHAGGRVALDLGVL